MAYLIRTLLIGIMVGCGAACSTVRSTLFSPNGCCPERVTKHLKGTPTTLPVASHIRLYVRETRYLTNQGTLLAISHKNGLKEIVRRRDLNTELIYKSELFTVDLKRPAAGLIDYKIDYQNADAARPNATQELQTVALTAYDETIVRTTDLLASLIKVAKLKNFGTGVVDDKKVVEQANYKEIVNEIATEFFDLNDPNVSERLQSFVETYFNNCTTPCLGGIHFQPPQPNPCASGTCGTCSKCASRQRAGHMQHGHAPTAPLAIVPPTIAP